MRLRFAADDRLVALVRAGDHTAFEILYDRHARELLSFCRYMLGSQTDGEDALQSTFASAHRALLADDRTVELRPWLFAIARNACLSILRARRPQAELPAMTQPEEDPAAKLEQQEQMREVLTTLLDLPERQRVSLVLSELHGFSQSEIGAVLGVRAEQVKSYIYQARSNLVSERDARGADCDAIRHELATARGPALLKSRLRRHLRSCPGCQQYAAGLSRQRDQFGALLPVLPSLALKRRVLDAALGNAPDAGAVAGAAAGGSVAATTAELAGGGAKAFIAKLLVGMAGLAASTGATTAVLHAPVASTAQVAGTSRPSRFAEPAHEPHAPADVLSSTPSAVPHAGSRSTDVGGHASQPVISSTQRSQASLGGAASNPASEHPSGVTGVSRSDASTEAHGKSEETHGASGGEARGRSEEAHGASGGEARGRSEETHGASGGEAHGKSEETHGASGGEAHGRSEETHGRSEETHGKGEEAHAKSEEAETHGKSEEAHGHSEQAAVHGKSEEVHGRSGEAAPAGQSLEPHGHSEEAQGHTEEAVAHGKSEEAHGKATGG